MKNKLTAVILSAVILGALMCSGCSLLPWMEKNSADPVSDVSEGTEQSEVTADGGETVADVEGSQADTPTSDTSASETKSEDGTIIEPVNKNEGVQIIDPVSVSKKEEQKEETPPFINTEDEKTQTEEKKEEENVVHVESVILDKYNTTITVGLTDMPWVTMTPVTATDKGEIWESSDTSIATVDQYGRILGVKPGVCKVTIKSHDNPSLMCEVSVTIVEQIKVTKATYIDGILIANKSYPLPVTYNPGVDPDAQTALDAMFAAAAEDEIQLFVNSGFRSYDLQTTIYNKYVGREGQTAADRYSARPGYSEHQTGLAFDLNSFEQDFGSTPEGIWLAEHCHEYGFIIRYAEDKEELTGYMYEPWHVRYVGTEVASALHESGQCLEEYLGITSVYAQ